MSKTPLILGLVLVVGFPVSNVRAQDVLKSGPQVGKFIPGSFRPFNINGKYGKKDENTPGRHHCLVCEYELNPVVMIFARDHKEEKSKDDKELTDLLNKIDEAVAKDRELAGNLRAFAVFLSPVGTDSVIETELAKTKDSDKFDPDELVKLSMDRKKLIERLDKSTSELKNVVVGYYAQEGPKGYNINPKAEVTVVLYLNFKVQANFAFEEGQLTAKAVDEIMAAVKKLQDKAKATAEEKTPAK
jgi:hypothetical protein